MRASQPKYTNKLTHFTGWSATINAALSSADAPTPATIHFVSAKLTLMPNAELTVCETVPVPPAQMHAMWQSVQHHQKTQGLNMELWCSESVLVETGGTHGIEEMELLCRALLLKCSTPSL